MRLLVRLLPLLFVVGLASCPEVEPVSTLDPDRLTDEVCAPDGTTRCTGPVFQSCQEGYWYNEEVCTSGLVCNREMGCVQCEPLSGPACDGDQVRACTGDGTFGEVLDVCLPGECEYGHCNEEDCPEGTDLIYVVDSSYQLLSFDPRDDAFTFNLLAYLNCPAGYAWPDWGGGGLGTPFSMSVDRAGFAWILYTSGEIFLVDTNNAESCAESSWSPGTGGFELFGMGFVSDEPGSELETLYIAGGTAMEMQLHITGELAAIEPEAVSLTTVGNLTPSELGPELTGTGDAELFAYFPGNFESSVAKVSKTTGQNEQAWAIPTLTGQTWAWAFAHWGGEFFIFVTYDDGWNSISQVRRFDRTTGLVDVAVESHPYRIVGAGVSTCAPTIMD
jgi:hypothetical protein